MKNIFNTVLRTTAPFLTLQAVECETYACNRSRDTDVAVLQDVTNAFRAAADLRAAVALPEGYSRGDYLANAGWTVAFTTEERLQVSVDLIGYAKTTQRIKDAFNACELSERRARLMLRILYAMYSKRWEMFADTDTDTFSNILSAMELD